MLGNFSCLCCCLLTFFKIIFFSKYSFKITIRVSYCLDLDLYQHYVSPDLGPNCLGRLSGDNKSLLARKELGKQYINIHKDVLKFGILNAHFWLLSKL